MKIVKGIKKSAARNLKARRKLSFTPVAIAITASTTGNAAQNTEAR